MTTIKTAPRFAKIMLTALCLASAGIAATSVSLAPAYAKGRQADDGVKHDRNDDRGRVRGGGADDPAGHR